MNYKLYKILYWIIGFVYEEGDDIFIIDEDTKLSYKNAYIHFKGQDKELCIICPLIIDSSFHKDRWWLFKRVFKYGMDHINKL